ncbi:hypothetical protein TMatcc_002067 [Talaromyces marneffei ATCC 18224]|uniref:Uncharacterized protein n=1 Tax=Talaromyces marneffei (strain ATCC 18224 / CBS 334.59 / QM 7333) TaxID=441960 RepID=B6QIL5_TALMQ|nr:hypothetical protein PMAA_097990 [Talaromyces marneffei ATCC 18224]
MAVDTDRPDGGNALRRWYIKRGFVERGRLEKIGFKKGRCTYLLNVDLTKFLIKIDTIFLQYSLNQLDTKDQV